MAMAQTRAQKRRNPPEDQDLDALTHSCHRDKTDYKSSSSPPKDRKRAIQDVLDPATQPSTKRPRTRSCGDDTFREASTKRDPYYPIGFWTREGCWPPEYFEIDSATVTTPSDEKPREVKCAPYQDPRYEALLATKRSFMRKSDKGITTESKTTCMTLLTSKQTIPTESLFRDDLFEQALQLVEGRNEARVLRDITPLICPSAEILAISGSPGLRCLIESTNEGWNNSIPLTGTRPQPDFSVGFRREAFTSDQLTKLSPFIGDFIAGDLSFFMATYYMYFPFLACEVKCGLDIADRQNAHTTTLAARGIVELFRLVGREDEVHRQILAFCISHDHGSARIYGCYPVINGKETEYFRHPIHAFYITALDRRDKWTAYQFTRNVYDIWMPEHFKRICSAIDQLPSTIDFDVAALSEPTGVSRGYESNLDLSEASSAQLVNEDELSGTAAAPNTPFLKPGPVKRRKSPVKKS